MSHPGELSARDRYSILRACAWSGPLFVAGYVLTWGWMGFNIPPLDPGIGINELHAHYLANATRIRAAFVLSVFVMPFYFVFSSVISRIMQRIEGDGGVLATIEQMGGVTTVVVGLVAGICWLTAGFRVEERSPEMVRALHDFGWLFFDTTYMTTGLQMLALGWVFLSDRRPVPLIPRWLCWYTFAVVAAFLPLSLLPFFYGGPFAWNGMFCYWISLGAWFTWVVLLCYHVFKAIGRLEGEEFPQARSSVHGTSVDLQDRGLAT